MRFPFCIEVGPVRGDPEAADQCRTSDGPNPVRRFCFPGPLGKTKNYRKNYKQILKYVECYTDTGT